MYPKQIIFGMDLYSILITLGIIGAMVYIRVLSDHRGLRGRWQNFLLVTTVVSVTLGYGNAVLMQGMYNVAEIGHFELTNSTGSTFYGGLIGGTVVFIAAYFLVGRFLFKDGYHLRHFTDFLNIAAAGITVAHGFGRLGCLMAGCCYGKHTHAWYGIYMAQAGGKVIPVQLYEAIFLLSLSGLLFWMFWTRKRHGMPLYMLTYGVWRYVIEFLRDDPRGETFIRIFTPSQLISVLLVAGSAGVWFLENWFDKRHPAEEPSDAAAGEAPAPALEENGGNETESERNDNV